MTTADRSSNADSDAGGDTDDRDVDEQFLALLEGLRTSLPGVQVLFAFLLTAPLQGIFNDLDTLERVTFAIAFYAAGVSSILLIAPSVHQRVRAPISGLERKSEVHLKWATWVAIAGSLAMAIAVLATVFLVSTLVFPLWGAVFATGAVGGTLCWSWVYLPLVTFARC